MLRKKRLIIWLALAMLAAPPLAAQTIERENDYDNASVDRYLDAEVWVNHSDGEYYEGDNVVIHFRANRDAFVAIYSIDTKGRVNLLFPSYPEENNFIYGGKTYSLPGPDEDYDLTVTGPEGWENIQIIASRERFPIPSWYNNSGLVFDEDDRGEYMDYLNTAHFVRYGGQRFSYDRAAIYVNEWENDYYRPIYYPHYPSWTVYGNAYIDYPYGGSVYINGIYWGVAPLYLPRIAVGWHTITIYDHYHHGWEHDFHVSRYNTVVFNNTVVQTSPGIKSKYKEVRTVGYRDPVKHGYPNYRTKATVNSGTVGVSKGVRGKTTGTSTATVTAPAKRHVRGSTKLIKSDRGYETEVSSSTFSGKKRKTSNNGYRSTSKSVGRSTTKSSGSSSRGTVKKGTGNSSTKKSTTTGRSTYRSSGSSKGKSSSTKGYYQKKSGKSSSSSRSSARSRKSSGKSSKGTVQKRSSGSSSKSSPSVKPKSNSGSKKSSSKSSAVKKSSPRKSSGSSSRSSGGKVKSSGGSKSRSSGAKAKSSSGSSKSGSSSRSGSKRTGGKRR